MPRFQRVAGGTLELPSLTGTLDRYISEINRFELLTPDEEFRLAVRFRKYNDMEAAQLLVVSNLRFVVKIAHEYRNYGMKLADLIQEGNIGLMHAVKKFDPYRGYRLISYAVWWIRAYIQNYVIKTWSVVKIGTTQAQRKLFFKLGQAKKKLQALSQKNPEIAESLGVKEIEIEQMDLRLSHRDLSLDASISEDGEVSHLDYLTYDGDDQEVSLIKKEEMELARQNIAGAMATLNEKESYIIRHRVMADNPETLQEIGNRYRITRERARQIEKQALKKLATALPYLGTDTPLLGN
jgi:RNA polymerase sigma-32 factor